MKLSYIIPVYKVEEYLNQCVESVLSQSIDDYEIILVDDGSPDNCPAMCDEYREKYPDIVKVIHKKNEGLAVARNAGFEAAQGEYVYFIDSDDYLLPDSVGDFYKKAIEYDADVIQASYVSLDDKTGETVRCSTCFETDRIYSHSDMEEAVNSMMEKNILIYVWRNLYKTSFLRNNSIFSDPKLRTMQDAPFNTEAFLKAERFSAVDIPVYCYRLREGSIQRKKYIRDYEEFYFYQWSVKLKAYEENCTKDARFYKAVSERNIKAFLPRMLMNYYCNADKESFGKLKKIGNSEMMRHSFRDYDINEFKSNSLDWWMVWCIKHRLYLPAHLICKKVLYKPN